MERLKEEGKEKWIDCCRDEGGMEGRMEEGMNG